MFDVLEHIPDLGFLARLQARYLAVAVPYCRWRELGTAGDAWFRTWRMRLPNEHLHHFDRDSLVALLAHSGFQCVTLNCFEDGRSPPHQVRPGSPQLRTLPVLPGIEVNRRRHPSWSIAWGAG
ncbi:MULTISPECIES: class I SAM-dependent methyltransferase [Mesorhizobium]|uniref:class I SAM-dependent methyltransferase n=1 Tax=Mesorhizobium sp. TaxID=1871066 RepID=UPI000ACD36FB|nr:MULTISPECIES: class I SAM-dependent methyltransferase [Mesorhizobium]